MAGKFIGAAAREFALNPRTLRYYEAVHLLPTPARSGGGYRIYDEEMVRRLGFIIKAKSLGLTLKEIRQIVTLGGNGRIPCDSVQEILREHVRRIDHQMAQLRTLKTDLQAVLARCRRNLENDGGVTKQKTLCPVIETLGDEKNSIKNGGERYDEDLLSLPGV